MKSLLITGASGFLGYNLCRAAAATGQWRVWGAYASHAIELDKATMIRADLTDYGRVKELFAAASPDAVIHCAAMSQPNDCEKDPRRSQAVNVDAACAIAGLCAQRGCPCAFTSTDLVFDGEHAPYREDDPVMPVNRYGEQKVMAEKGMKERYPSVSICRMSLMYGAPSPASQSFIGPFIAKLRAGEELRLFYDEIRTPVSAESASKGLLLALENPGIILHLGGNERLSRYEFGLILCDTFGFNKDLIIKLLRNDLPMPAARPRDVSLDISKAYALGYEPQLAKNALQNLYDSEID